MLCDTLSTLGSSHLTALSSPDQKLALLQRMLSFASQPYVLLADKALPMWVKLLQEDAQSVGHAAVAAAGAGGGAPREATLALPSDCVAALMDMAAGQLQVGLSLGMQDLPAGAFAPDQAQLSSRNLGGQALLPRRYKPEPAHSSCKASKRMSCPSALPSRGLQKRGAHIPTEDEEFPPYFDTFAVRVRGVGSVYACVRGYGGWRGVAACLTAVLLTRCGSSAVVADRAVLRRGWFSSRIKRSWHNDTAGLQGLFGPVPLPPVGHRAVRGGSAAGAGTAGGIGAAGRRCGSLLSCLR